MALPPVRRTIFGYYSAVTIIQLIVFSYKRDVNRIERKNKKGKIAMPRKAKYYVRPDGLHETIRTINGKRKAFRGRTDAEVDRKILEYKGEIENGRPFKAVAEEWEKEHFPTLAPNSLRNYRPAYKRAVKEFGEISIKSIKPQDIKGFILDFANKGIAKKTANTQLLILNQICSYAVVNGDLDNNPCAYISVPKTLSKERREAASPEDEKRVKESSDIWLLPYLILYTGLRKGEALALQGRDINKKERTIPITKSVYHVDNKPYIKRPKTEAGNRIVPILDPLIDKIPNIPDDCYLFSLDGGKTPLTEWEYNKLWKEFSRKTGITATAHQLRHSYATMLFECGIDVKDAQDLLGHSTAAMTQDIYTHLRDSRRKDTAAKLNQAIADLAEDSK